MPVVTDSSLKTSFGDVLSKSEFLKIDILNWMIFFFSGEDSCPLHCRLSRIHSLTQQSNPHSIVTTNICLEVAKASLRTKIAPFEE